MTIPKKQDTPVPVLIAEEQNPVPVVIEAAPPPPKPHTVQAGQGTVLAPTTTEQEDIVTAGQRRVNLIWEFTQAIIAVCITFAIVFVSVRGIDSPELSNAFFVIIGFYYSRVNHAAIGGVGKKPEPQRYEGR